MRATRVIVVLWVALVGCGEVVDETVDAAMPDADPCENATCACTEATEATDCGSHEYCNVAGPGRACACVAGYTDGVSGCVWTGVVKDPAIAGQTDWMPANGALLNPTATGGIDPGEASFVTSAICGLGLIKQTLEMPTFAKAEPLVLEVSYKNQIVTGGGPGGQSDSVLMGASFGSGWAPLKNFTDAIFHTERICLGDAGYAAAGTSGRGGPVVLSLGPYAKAVRCPASTITNFAIDHAQIVPANAGECGTVRGESPNFDAEGTTGWTFTATGTSTAGFASGLGAGASRAGRIRLDQRCDSASMSTKLDVPSVAGPAVEMYLSTTAGSFGSIIIGGPTSSTGAVTMGLPFPTGAPAGVQRFCLPPSLRGQSTTIGFQVTNAAGGSCADILGFQLVVDNLRVVDDPTCAGNGIPNPGFESPGVTVGMFGSGPQNAGAPGGNALVRTGATLAHAGSRYLALESLANCSSLGMNLLPTVPAPAGTAGPALTFFANIPATANSETRVRPQGGTTVVLPEGGGWTKHTVCLDPVYAGRGFPVLLSQYGGGGSCDGYPGGVAQTALIDDLEIITDPMCPAM